MFVIPMGRERMRKPAILQSCETGFWAGNSHVIHLSWWAYY
jgi:hypothetical protein